MVVVKDLIFYKLTYLLILYLFNIIMSVNSIFIIYFMFYFVVF